MVGDTIGLRSHHNLRNLAALDNARRSERFETRLIDLICVVNKEPQPRDTAFYALHIRFTAESGEYLASKYIVPILFSYWFSRDYFLSSCRIPRSTLALWQYPIGT